MLRLSAGTPGSVPRAGVSYNGTAFCLLLTARRLEDGGQTRLRRLEPDSHSGPVRSNRRIPGAAIAAHAARETQLAWSEGFVVDSPSGEVGVVDEIVFGFGGRVAALRVIAGGSAGRWVLPVEEVVDVLPRSQTILVAHHPDGPRP